MFSMNGSRKAGVRFLAIGACAVALASSIASAETIMTVNGKVMDSDLLDLYMQSRVQKPLDQVTAQERDALINELTDLFVLSTIDLANELAEDPNIAAQLELQRMGVLARAVAATLAGEIVVTEEEIEVTYAEQIKLAPTEQFKARHILVETQGEAVEIIELLLAGGSFEELAIERSTGPSGPSGGDLGWFSPNQMVKPFSDAVAVLDDGRYTTDPVQTQFGWHVILREETRAAEPPPLEGVRETIEARVQQEKLRAKINELKVASIEQ